MFQHLSTGMFSYQTLHSNSRGRSALYRTYSNTCLDGVEKLIVVDPGMVEAKELVNSSGTVKNKKD